MAHCSVIVHPPPSDLLNVMQSPRETGQEYLDRISRIVSTHKRETFKLKRPAGATWTVGDLNDTIYKDDDDTVYAWSNFYLREEVVMRVLGVVDGTPFPGEQLVLMTCEDTQMYVYDGDELHLVAPSLQRLCQNGISYPPTVTYYYGEAFKDMTNKDWDDLRKGPVGMELDKKHHQMVMGVKHELLSHLPTN